MVQQSVRNAKGWKGMLVSILVLVVPAVVIMLAIHISRDDSEGKYKYCTVEKAWAEYRAGGDLSGNTDYTRVGWVETRECGKLALQSPRIRINQWMIIWPPLNQEGITRCT